MNSIFEIYGTRSQLIVFLNNMLITTSLKNQLGSGIYTVSDISQLLTLPKPKVRRYLNQYWDERLGKKLFNDTYTWSLGNKVKAVNFFTLIELYTCFQLQEFGISPKEILRSRESIARDLNIRFPFANSKLLTDGRRIWYEYKDAIVKADGSGQMYFVEIIRDFASRLEFNSEKIAEKFWPAGRQSCVLVDPRHQFGQPVIDGTNINTEVIFSMIESGESVKSISILYDITEREIRDVIRFYKKVA